MIWSGFLIGLLGSFHCAGMCGPLAMALPDSGNSQVKFLFGRFLYNLGRAVTYAAMGLLFGLIGYGVYVSGIQQVASISMGLLILISAIPAWSAWNGKWHQPVLQSLKKALLPLLQKTSVQNLFIIGLLNGLLPCGFVYMGIAGALLTASALDGAIFMFLFGLGTMPMMMLMSVNRRFFTPAFRFQINRFMPYFTILIGVLLIVRGLNLDIPFISPDISANGNVPAGCCHK